jgi:hypothetical protein
LRRKYIVHARRLDRYGRRQDRRLHNKKHIIRLRHRTSSAPGVAQRLDILRSRDSSPHQTVAQIVRGTTRGAEAMAFEQVRVRLHGAAQQTVRHVLFLLDGRGPQDTERISLYRGPRQQPVHSGDARQARGLLQMGQYRARRHAHLSRARGAQFHEGGGDRRRVSRLEHVGKGPRALVKSPQEVEAALSDIWRRWSFT